LEKIRAKREMTIKTEDSGDMSHNDDNGSNVDSGCSQTNVYSAVNPLDVKSLLDEYVLRLYDDILGSCMISYISHVNLCFD